MTLFTYFNGILSFIFSANFLSWTLRHVFGLYIIIILKLDIEAVDKLSIYLKLLQLLSIIDLILQVDSQPSVKSLVFEQLPVLFIYLFHIFFCRESSRMFLGGGQMGETDNLLMANQDNRMACAGVLYCLSFFRGGI